MLEISAASIEQEAQALTEKVYNATRIVTPDASMRAHATWEVRLMIRNLHPSDLTEVELMGLAVILAGANARVLSTPSTPPTLRLAPEIPEVVCDIA